MATATAETILSQLATIINEVVGVETSQISPESSFSDDLGVDSLSMVEIIYAVEDSFNITIPEDESKNLRTVGDAVAHIERALAAA
ncbi:MAG: acyl carrier protein [Propionibacteriaceae bacterium]|jgi:acyl carrier protein|nr:acyl carrier protein [Propionibacteriaceae bacterium]